MTSAAMYFANYSKNSSFPPQKRGGAVTFHIIKIISLMKVTMILNQEVLTSLSTDKGIMEL